MNISRTLLRVAVLFACLVVIVVADYWLRSSAAGQLVSKSFWGLNIRHYSEFVGQLDSNSHRSFEEESLAALGELSADEPSHLPDSGIYDRELQILDQTESSFGTVRYTTDGSIPMPSDPILDQTVIFSSTSALRARQFSPTLHPSRVISKILVFEQQPDITVASLILDPVYLFDRHAGIIANPMARGRSWERPAEFSLISPATGETLSTEVRLRIHGATSRSASIKSFRLYFQSSDVSPRNWIPGASEKISIDQREWVLRHAGDGSLFRDRLANAIASDIGLLTSPSIPVVLYINGEMWGVFDLMERVNPQFVAGKVEIESLTLLRGSLSGPASVIGGSRDWRVLYDEVRQSDMSDSSQYQAIEQRIDIDNLIDFWAFQLYIADNDRPNSNMNIYRVSESSPWSFLVWDSDLGFNYKGAFTDHDTLAWHLRNKVRPDLKPFGSPDSAWMLESTILFRSLMQNPIFRQSFQSRCEQLLQTVFSAEHVQSVFDRLLEQYESVAHIEFDRFQNMSTAAGKQEYGDQIEMIRTFIDRRADVVHELLDRELSIN